MTSPESVITNSFDLTAPTSDPSFLGPAYTGPSRAEEGVAPAVTSNTTEERSEPRSLDINKSFSTAAQPGYDISTYITDPYETISGEVQQGVTTADRDGTPDGGGEPDRPMPLTLEEIQYLADRGYLPEGTGASTPTVRPSTTPIKYDISKFISGIGSLATSGNRT
jgi:hypothetical protein